MKRNPFIAGLLSLFVPGLGQIYCGEGSRGAIIIVGGIIVANLNILILPLLSLANPILPPPDFIRAVWAYWIPRITHDVSSLWSIVYWIWAITDAVIIAKRAQRTRE